MQPDEFFRQIDEAPSLSQLQMTIAEDWTQGRTVFGGLSAGLAYQVLKNVVAQGRLLRSITFNFVGPLAANVPFSFTWQVLREGKSATQISGNIVQNGQVCLAALGCFSADRVSDVKVDPGLKPLPAPPRGLGTARRASGAPSFTRHVELAIEAGDAPFSGSDNACFTGWVRFANAPAEITEAHIITLIDAWPPTVLQMFSTPAPASTMSWNLELVHPHGKLAPRSWLAYEAGTVQANGGYAHSEAQVHNEAGELIAISRQLVAAFDKTNRV